MTFESPYPGLRPFRREESFLFFGREEQTDQLLRKLADNRFISVVGLSGCGKSSLTRAGMIAALESGYFDSQGSYWRVAAMRPGNQPLFHLAQSLLADNALRPEYARNFKGENQETTTMLPFLLASLRRGALGLVEILQENPLPAHTNLLILVDQFEELFRYPEQKDRNEIDLFVATLRESVEQTTVPIYVVITMRSDFFGECAQFQGLPELINAGQFLVPRLNREQQRNAITNPARVFGSTVDPRLENHILNEMRNDPDQLSILQHCLMRMWFHAKSLVRSQEDEKQVSKQGFPIPLDLKLTWKHYEVVGGVQKALNRHAEETYKTLTKEQKKIAEYLFRSITERSTGRRDIRRPCKIRQVAAVANTSVDTIIKVANVFRTPERCFITPTQEIHLESETTLDISHESLIRQWKRLDKWADKEAESARDYTRLEDAALQHEKGKAALWREPDLTFAIQWKELQKPTPAWAERYGKHFDLAMEFLDESKQAEEERIRQIEEAIQQQQEEQKRQIKAEQRARSAKPLRRLTAGLAFMLWIAIGAAGLAVQERNRANEQKEKAVAAERKANEANDQLQSAIERISEINEKLFSAIKSMIDASLSIPEEQKVIWKQDLKKMDQKQIEELLRALNQDLAEKAK